MKDVGIITADIGPLGKGWIASTETDGTAHVWSQGRTRQTCLQALLDSLRAEGLTGTLRISSPLSDQDILQDEADRANERALEVMAHL